MVFDFGKKKEVVKKVTAFKSEKEISQESIPIEEGELGTEDLEVLFSKDESSGDLGDLAKSNGQVTFDAIYLNKKDKLYEFRFKQPIEYMGYRVPGLKVRRDWLERICPDFKLGGEPETCRFYNYDRNQALEYVKSKIVKKK